MQNQSPNENIIPNAVQRIYTKQQHNSTQTHQTQSYQDFIQSTP